VQPLAAVDSVQAELYRCIRTRQEDGSLQEEWELWKLGEHLQEWLILATAPAGDTKASAVLSVERTPGLYNIYIDMLFIGLSDNTRLESYVSLYKTFCHVNMKATTVEQMFLYHAGLEAERLPRSHVQTSPCMGTMLVRKSSRRSYAAWRSFAPMGSTASATSSVGRSRSCSCIGRSSSGSSGSGAAPLIRS
jgi:hypothetical protein